MVVIPFQYPSRIAATLIALTNQQNGHLGRLQKAKSEGKPKLFFPQCSKPTVCRPPDISPSERFGRMRRYGKSNALGDCDTSFYFRQDVQPQNHNQKKWANSQNSSQIPNSISTFSMLPEKKQCDEEPAKKEKHDRHCPHFMNQCLQKAQVCHQTYLSESVNPIVGQLKSNGHESSSVAKPHHQK